MRKTLINSSILLLITNLNGCSFLSDEENIRHYSNPPVIQSFKEIEFKYMHQAHPERFPFTGGAAIDIDGDGKMEIFVSGSKDQPNGLFSYQNGKMIDVSSGTGLTTKESSYGATAVDMDNDGDTDLLLAQYTGVWLYSNNNGQFTGKQLQLTLPKDSFPINIAVTDLNKDGLPDLYINNFVSPNRFVAATFNDPGHAKKNIMLLNKGNGLFEDITEKTGTAGIQNTFHSSFVDLDGNGFQDLILANNTGSVEIFRNKGNLVFEKQNIDTGLGFWMGLGVGDIDKDGNQDLFFSNTGMTIPKNLLRGDLRDDQKVTPEWLLLKNDGNWNFTNATVGYELDGYGFGWGGVFEDINLDGEIDLLVAQNYMKWPAHKLSKLPNKAFLQLQQNGKNAFYHMDSLGLNNPFYGQTTLIADLNVDGKPDVIWLNMNGPVRAFINQSDHNFLKVTVPDNAKYLGAQLWISTQNGRSYTKQITANTGMSSDQTPNVFFGLGKESKIDALYIKTADGNTQTIQDPAINKTVILK